MNDETINGDSRYINYKFYPFTVPVLIAFFPLIYLIPTIGIVVRIIKVYIQNAFGRKKDDRINIHVFSVIVLHLIFSTVYLVTDYTTIRIPATGLLTSWCASQQPNHGLKVLFLLSVYFNYTAMLFPCLLSVLRLIPMYYPLRVEEICARIVRICTPLIVLYPFLFCFPLFPALGDCRQLLGDYQFGGIYFYWRGALFEIKQAQMLLVNSAFWLVACTIVNVLLYKKLERMRSNRESSRIQRAEKSLTMITLSMFPSFIANFVFIFVFLISPPLTAYFIAWRPYGCDCEFVLVAWIFYLTHPMFKKNQVATVQTQRVRTNEGTS